MIKSVDKALNILTFMIDQGADSPVQLKTIAAACQLNQSTCSHLVDTLCASAFLEKVSRKDGYMLGPMGYCISSTHYYRHELAESALPVLRSMVAQLGETATLSIFSNHRVFVPLTVAYDKEKISYSRIKRGSLYCSAAGRIFAAHMAQDQLNELIALVGYPQFSEWDILPTRENINMALAEIRRQGYAVIPKVRNYLSAVAAPVIVNNRVQAVAGVFMPMERFTEEFAAECVIQVKRAAKLVGQRLTERLDGMDNGAVYGAYRTSRFDPGGVQMELKARNVR